MRSWTGPDRMTTRHTLSGLLAVCLIGLALSACGGDDKTDATSTSLPPTPTVSNDPTTSATLAPGEVTAGQIADRIATRLAEGHQLSIDHADHPGLRHARSDAGGRVAPDAPSGT